MSTLFLHRRAPRLGVLWSVLVAACLLPAAAHAASPGTAPAAVVALKLSVTDAPGATPRPATLTCLGTWANATGYLRGTPEEGCRQAGRLARWLLSPPDPERVCTQVFGGPQTATVDGAINGRRIPRAFSRTDGCELADWDQMGLLLAPTAINSSRQLVDYHRSGGIAGLEDRLTSRRTASACTRHAAACRGSSACRPPLSLISSARLRRRTSSRWTPPTCPAPRSPTRSPTRSRTSGRPSSPLMGRCPQRSHRS
jgi:hypothetical protein